jgi:hypothetical protein
MAIVGRGRLRARAVSAAAAALAALVAAAPAPASSPTATMGVYRGAGAPSEVAAFERWNGGRRVAFALDFLPMDSWRHVEDPSWWAAQWSGSPYRMVYAVPLLPRDGSTLATGATGAYNRYFEGLARTLVAYGQGDAVLRIGWEFNGSWFPWDAAKDRAAFVAYWREVVTAIRAVPGARFAFDWNANLGTGTIAPEKVYPGDAYVDIVGADVYDQGWFAGYADPVKRWQSILDQPNGLSWLRAFAAAHGKPISLPEWGLTIRDDGHGGGDNTYYIERMHEWIGASNVAYHAYFEYDAADGRHRMMLGQFPRAGARFRALFGPAPTAAPEPPQPAAAPTGAPQPAPAPTAAPQPAPAPTAAPGPKPAPTTAPPRALAAAAAPRRAPARLASVRTRRNGSWLRVGGRVTPAASGHVRVQVDHAAGGRWRRQRARLTPVRSGGRFRARVARPAARRWRIVLRYRDGAGHWSARRILAASA